MIDVQQMFGAYVKKRRGEFSRQQSESMLSYVERREEQRRRMKLLPSTEIGDEFHADLLFSNAGLTEQERAKANKLLGRYQNHLDVNDLCCEVGFTQLDKLVYIMSNLSL